MHKYGYVDQAVDARYHRPTLKREVNKISRSFLQFFISSDHLTITFNGLLGPF